MIAIVDFGVGNLRSVQKGLAALGHDAVITADADQIETADGIILPGVGAFGDAMVSLRRLGLLSTLRGAARSGKPLLGICLGMQLLFSVSEEHGQHVGLGIIPGHVKRFRGDFKIPQVGWNQVHWRRPCPLADGVADGEYAYFVHSFYVEPLDSSVVVGVTDYFIEFPSVVAAGHVFGMQFHPEKSAAAGLRMLSNFASLCAREVRA